jgi:hypothetical protein
MIKLKKILATALISGLILTGCKNSSEGTNYAKDTSKKDICIDVSPKKEKCYWGPDIMVKENVNDHLTKYSITSTEKSIGLEGEIQKKDSLVTVVSKEELQKKLDRMNEHRRKRDKQNKQLKNSIGELFGDEAEIYLENSLSGIQQEYFGEEGVSQLREHFLGAINNTIYFKLMLGRKSYEPVSNGEILTEYFHNKDEIYNEFATYRKDYSVYLKEQRMIPEEREMQMNEDFDNLDE